MVVVIWEYVYRMVEEIEGDEGGIAAWTCVLLWQHPLVYEEDLGENQKMCISTISDENCVLGVVKNYKLQREMTCVWVVLAQCGQRGQWTRY